MNKKSSDWIIQIVLFILGACIMIGGICNRISFSKFKDNAVETTATVTSVNSYTESNGDISYDVYISYKVNDQTYKDRYSTKSRINSGSTIKIYYDKKDPSIIKREDTGFTGIFLIVFGMILIGIGLAIIYGKTNKK